MDESRITKLVFNLDYQICKNWSIELKDILYSVRNANGVCLMVRHWMLLEPDYGICAGLMVRPWMLHESEHGMCAGLMVRP